METIVRKITFVNITILKNHFSFSFSLIIFEFTGIFITVYILKLTFSFRLRRRISLRRTSSTAALRCLTM